MDIIEEITTYCCQMRLWDYGTADHNCSLNAGLDMTNRGNSRMNADSDLHNYLWNAYSDSTSSLRNGAVQKRGCYCCFV